MTAISRVLLLLLFVCPEAVLAAPFPPGKSETVIKQAVVRASSCIVKIETIGGLDILAGELANTGPTTGIVVSEDGYIITSSFNFAANPSSILVSLPESKKRLPAEIVARDHLKMLTLLKIKAKNLSPAIPAAMKKVRVGHWAIALGKTYESPLPNVSLGLISALDRIEGKAIQTDAKISPANYGGPLIDIHGDVLGVLVPLSGSGKSLTEGVNWYDSGIGFAIPLEHVYTTLERLKSGKDLKAGLMGTSFGRTPPFLAEPVIKEVRPNSPSALAGLKAEDRILSIDGKPVKTVANLKQGLGKKYAGESVSLTVKRGEQTEEFKLTLTEKLEPFRHGWVGILGERLESDLSGAIVRYVTPGSPAAKAGLQSHDRIVALQGVEITSYDQLREQIFVKQPGVEMELVYIRDGDQREKVKITTGTLPSKIPSDLPLPVLFPEGDKGKKKAEKTGDIVNTLAEHKQKYKLYVPEEYHAEAAHGIMFWLSAGGEPIPKQELAQWKRVCRTRGMILVVPVSKELKAWSSDDVAWLMECLEEVEENYNADEKMTCLITAGKKASFPWQLAYEHRETFEGLFSLGIPGRFRAPFNEPGYRLQTLISVHDKKEKEISKKLENYLNKEGHAILLMPREEKFSVENFDALGRWVDGLGGL